MSYLLLNTFPNPEAGMTVTMNTISITMDLQKKYYKITTVSIIALFMVSVSYYQQIALQNLSQLFCKYRTLYSVKSIKVSAPQPDVMKSWHIYTVTSRQCDHTQFRIREKSEIKNI